MIGRLTADKFGYREDKDGNAYLIMRITGESRYNIKPIISDIRRSGKPVTASFDFKKNKRSLDQNALLWALLTIYAEALGGGRRGSVQPEEIYYQMLNKYGVAQFLIMQEEAVEQLRVYYRDIKVIDDAVVIRNGKRTPAKLVKCIVGSSRYDTREMTQLIDGVFDELALIGVDAQTSRQVSDYYEEWNSYKEGGNE